jgi:starch synthase (maltosyl-transferring)
MQGSRLLIYNLFPLLAGPFPAWREHLERAVGMGFTWVFVNPIQKPGGSGSLYAVADYFDFNPLFIDPHVPGTAEDQVRDALRTAKDLNLRVMIDLVVNHCSVDSNLLSKHPEWFEWEHGGEVVHPSCLDDGRKVVWGDLAKFDHRHTRDPEGLYRFVRDALCYLLDLGFSGFRCDAAYQVPARFWKRLIREVKSLRPDILFTAETLGCTPEETRTTAAAGFDYVFNSAKWWDFKARWLMRQYEMLRDVVPSIAFPESHDTARLCDELGGNGAGLQQRYLFAAFFSAGLMMPIGYEFGFRKKLDVVKTRPQDWEETGIDLRSFIREVNRMKLGHEILQKEAPMEILQHGNPDVLVLWKGSVHAREEALLILNTDVWQARHFEADRLGAFMETGSPIVDVSPEDPQGNICGGVYLDLRPGQGRVFVASRAGTAPG